MLLASLRLMWKIWLHKLYCSLIHNTFRYLSKCEYKIKAEYAIKLERNEKIFYNLIEIPISTCYKGSHQITRDIPARRERAHLDP